MFVPVLRRRVRSLRPALKQALSQTTLAPSVRTVRPFASTALIREEPTLSRAERLKKRFWKTVTLQEPDAADAKVGAPVGYKICLDGRPIRGPAGGEIVVPPTRKLLAACIAQEWSDQDSNLKPHTLPLTSLTARALEGCSDPLERASIEADLLRYLENETVCFQEDQPDALVKLQHQHWDPLLAHINHKFNLDIKPFTGLLGNDHDPRTLDTFRTLLSQLDSFNLAAFERSVLITKSFLISVALVSGQYGVEAAAQAASVEVQSQINRWGAVEDSHDVDHADLRRTLGSVALATVVNA